MPLEVKSKRGGTKFTLDDPPAGMAIDGAGVITWKPTEKVAATIQRIIVDLDDGNGAPLKYIFRVAVPADK